MTKQKTISLLVALFLFGIINNVQSATISSSFDSGTEGWVLTGGSLTYVGSGGNPGGFLKARDTDQDDMTLFAPSKFLGDLSAYNGGTLSFDAIETVNSSAPWGSLGIMTMVSSFWGNTFYLSHDFYTLNENPKIWTTISAPLDSQSWGLSPTIWSFALSNITHISINIESGSQIVETVGIDNIMMSSGPIKMPSVPIPASLWLLFSAMIPIVFRAHANKN